MLNLANLTPGKHPTYKELTGGRWSVNGKVYPVPRPKRGKIRVLDSHQKDKV